MFEMGNHLASLAAERAQEASTAAPSGAVLAEWMTTTGPELTETETEPEATVDETTGTDGPIDDTGSDRRPARGFRGGPRSPCSSCWVAGRRSYAR